MCNFVTYSIQYTCTYMHSILVHVFRNKAKGRISKRVFQENKARQVFRKTNISYPLIRTRTCAYQGVRNVRFSENLACFVFLKHPFLDSSFCLITDDVQYTSMFFRHIKSSRKENLIRPVYLTRKTSS